MGLEKHTSGNGTTGIAYIHHSNGHTRLPNNGWNSFTSSISGLFVTTNDDKTHKEFKYGKSVCDYGAISSGLGMADNDLDYLNRKKKVVTAGFEYGRVHNNTIKYGIGAFYRVYENYYDCIAGNEFLVRDGKKYDYLKCHPWNNASNIGIYGPFELLLDHIGLELAAVANLYKPAFSIDCYLNNGWDDTSREFPDYWQFVAFRTSYRLKKGEDQLSSAGEK